MERLHRGDRNICYKTIKHVPRLVGSLLGLKCLFTEHVALNRVFENWPLGGWMMA